MSEDKIHFPKPTDVCCCDLAYLGRHKSYDVKEVDEWKQKVIDFLEPITCQNELNKEVWREEFKGRFKLAREVLEMLE